MSLSQVEDEEPVKWYTFHSAKTGRDYYYEPNSKVVTWIRPDDLHTTYPSVPQTPLPTQAETVEKRVSFHESVHENDTGAPRERGMTSVMSNDDITKSASIGSSRVKTPVLLLVICLCILVVTASYMEWLPRGPLGSSIFGVDESISSKQTGAADSSKKAPKPHKDAHVQQTRNTVKKESPVRNTDNEARRARHETMARQQTSWRFQQEQQNSPEKSSRTEHHSKPNEKQRDRKSNMLKDAGHEEMHSIDSKDAANPVKKRCMVPFAHVFSKQCRTILAQQPVYDMDALLDSLI